MIHSLSQKILPQKSSHQSSYFYPSLTEKTNMTPRTAIKINLTKLWCRSNQAAVLLIAYGFRVP